MCLNWLAAAFDIVLLFFFFTAVFYFILGIFSFLPGKKDTENFDFVSFAVLIPAHNEANVILSLLNSVKNANYPKEKIKVFVIADRCSDSTADIARASGASVIEKADADSGKGAALRYACRILKEQLNQFDYVTVFDADNIADSEYFLEMASMHSSGNPAVQGYVDVKNPYTSWIALAHAMWYWVPNRLQKTALYNLGRSVTLQGTGFSLETELFLSAADNDTGMAEDAEYTLFLNESGINVSYEKKAVVYDEKPDTFTASVHQRIRWVQGLLQAQKKYRRRFCKKGFVTRILPSLWSDGLSTTLFCVFSLVRLGATVICVSGSETPFLKLWTSPLNYIILNLYIFGTYFMILLGLKIDKKLSYKIFLNIFGYLLYILSWIPVFFIGILRRSKNTWYHTQHHGCRGRNRRI